MPFCSFITSKRFSGNAILGLLMLVTLGACSDNDSSSNSEEPEQTISEQQAIDAMVKVLEKRSLALKTIPTDQFNKEANKGSGPPQTEDYVSTSIADDGDREIVLNIDSEGNLIPSAGWRDANPNYCSDKDKFMKAPVKQLVFKVFTLPDGYDAFVQYIDIATGKVEEQQEAESSSLDEAMNKAWRKLNQSVGKATDPCGDEAGFKLVFTSKTTFEASEDGDVSTTIEKVTAEIPLTYNQDRAFFEGNGKLTWKRFDAANSSSVTYDCDLPPDADFNVIFKAGNKETPADSMEGSIEFYNVEKCPCEVTADGNTVESPFISKLPTVWLTLHKDQLDDITYPTNPDRNIGYFTLKDWQSVPANDNVIAETSYDQSTQKQGATYQEETTIQFSRQ